MSNLYKEHQTKGKSELKTKLGITNIMATPSLVKIVINTGLGEALVNKKAIEEMGKQLAVISGQKPIVTYAKHDISSFKLRRGEAIGLKITLRGKRMYNFFEKLVKIILPRIRDFHGVSTSGFDGKGGYTLGMSEQIVFPEIEYSQVDKIRGLEITIVTTGRDKKETKELLEILGMPFRKERLASSK
jgi:large subunit ribosomal protein L5